MLNYNFLTKDTNTLNVGLLNPQNYNISNLINKNNIVISKNKKLLNGKDLLLFSNYIKNQIKCFIRGYSVLLEIIGLGYSVTVKNNILRLNIGYNHSIFYKIPLNIIIKSKRKFLYCYSFSLFDLKNTIVDIKNFRNVNPYKLKGIKEKNELYKKKN